MCDILLGFSKLPDNQDTITEGEYAIYNRKVTVNSGTCYAFGNSEITQNGGTYRAYDNSKIIKGK